MSLPPKIKSYIKYLTDLGYKVTGTYIPKSKRKSKTKFHNSRKNDEEDEDDEEEDDEDDEDEEDEEEDEEDDEDNDMEDEDEDTEQSEDDDTEQSEDESYKTKTLSPKEKTKRFVRDNKHNWRLLDRDCEGNFSKSDLVNFSKRMGVKPRGSSKNICNSLKKELKKY